MSNESLEQILKTNIEKIRKAKEHDKLVVFVGAGVSVNSELPTWYNLVSELAEEMGMNVGNSVDSFMQIPQYYFNERGEKEYLEKIEGILNRKTYKPNIIHEQIIDLNPKHIITTNYDDLLEQSFKLYNKSYHVVSDNSDLPYASQDQMLIKMHGCLKKKNIVLKEDDYLSYSSNFKLIETYIKSLFSTHIILFIGYSAEDPNFKLIFQWVKDILNKDFQPAYLIDISEEFNLLKYNYYKNRGIHIIYSNNSEHSKEDGLEECKLENPKGKKLFNILKRINDIEDEHIISRIYNNLREFENVNAVQPKDILKATGYNSEMVYENGLIRGVKIGGELYELLSNIKGIGKNKKEVNLFRKDLLSNYKQVLRYILSVLKKANIRGIKFLVRKFLFHFYLVY
ncbi:SIR2 family protein [Bacillus wiedmannii]